MRTDNFVFFRLTITNCALACKRHEVSQFMENQLKLTFISRPTFKTLTPTSRTQLKQQLQREQLLQEAERKEAERKALQQQQKRHEELKVPLQSIGVDVPPQILQV